MSLISSAGRAPLHWSQMLACVRRPVAMWHVLREDLSRSREFFSSQKTESRDQSPSRVGHSSDIEEPTEAGLDEGTEEENTALEYECREHS